MEEKRKPLSASEINRLFFRPRKKRSAKNKNNHWQDKPVERGDVSNYNNANYTQEELEFMRAIDAEKRKKQKPMLSWSEVLAVALRLGYRKGVKLNAEEFPSA